LLLHSGPGLAEDTLRVKSAGQDPLWELGVAAVGARLPHYIGSDEYENYAYPVPYFIYRGEFLRAERDGLRGIFYKGEKFETSLSAWGNPPVPDDNDARQGMEELDAVGEIGPAVRYYFYRRGWRDHLYLQAALRTAFSFGFNGGLDIDTDYQGLNGGLVLSYQNKSAFEAHDLSIFFKAGLNFADDTYNNYFYGVERRYATARRARYEADAGYAGFSLSSSLYKRLTPRLAVGCYARWNNLDGAVFEDSPLVRDKNTYAVGATVVWKITESSKPAR
jgi:outer membrane scaffolding protein for murein synthesis (MipA/OmpV family)